MCALVLWCFSALVDDPGITKTKPEEVVCQATTGPLPGFFIFPLLLLRISKRWLSVFEQNQIDLVNVVFPVRNEIGYDQIKPTAG